MIDEARIAPPLPPPAPAAVGVQPAICALCLKSGFETGKLYISDIGTGLCRECALDAISRFIYHATGT